MARMAFCNGNIPVGYGANRTTRKCGAACLDENFKPLPGSYHGPLLSRGGKNGYLCPDCVRRFFAITEEDDISGYLWENSLRRGKVSDKQSRLPFQMTVSQELEMMRPTLRTALEVQSNDYILTGDRTVDLEAKSPIYYGRQSIAKYADTIERLINDGDMAITSECGTHTHFGAVFTDRPEEEAINVFFMEWFRQEEVYEALIKPIADILCEHEEKTVRFFGRSLGGWARYPAFYSPCAHENFINLQHNHTVEIRLPRFKNAAQYRRFLEYGEAVIREILDCYYSEDKDTTKAGKRLAKLTRKYVIDD